MSGKRQPVLLVFLGLILGAVLYTSLIGGDSDEIDSGFDGPIDLGLLVDEPIPARINDWRPPVLARNPFVGPFESVGDNGSVTQADTGEEGETSESQPELINTPISPSELEPLEDPQDLDLGDFLGATPGEDIPEDLDLDELLGLSDPLG